MGFGASQVFDPLAQIEIPVLGQVLNLLAMFVFISVGGFRNVFLYHIFSRSDRPECLGCSRTRQRPERGAGSGLGDLFAHSFIMALPILGALLMVSVSMGLLAKAAPQMNLLMIGFPISITVGFLMMWTAFPFLAQGFSTIIENGFDAMSRLIAESGGGGELEQPDSSP
jgi:flagellar biosynthetic protein FliR